FGVPRRVGDRSAGVAVVVADHEPVAGREHPAEALLPPNIDPPTPITRRMGGSAGSPNASVQSSTPFASIARSATSPLRRSTSRARRHAPVPRGRGRAHLPPGIELRVALQLDLALVDRGAGARRFRGVHLL